MLRFFYDSLDTLKKVKKPTVKETREFTIHVFIAVIIGAVLFFVFDNIRGNFYKQIYQTFGGSLSHIAPLEATAPLPIPGTEPVDTQLTPQAENAQLPAEDEAGAMVLPPPAEQVQVEQVPTEPTPEPPAA